MLVNTVKVSINKKYQFCMHQMKNQPILEFINGQALQTLKLKLQIQYQKRQLRGYRNPPQTKVFNIDSPDILNCLTNKISILVRIQRLKN